MDDTRYPWFMVEVKEDNVWTYVGSHGMGSQDRSVAEDYASGIANRRGTENVRVVEFVRKD